MARRAYLALRARASGGSLRSGSTSSSERRRNAYRAAVARFDPAPRGTADLATEGRPTQITSSDREYGVPVDTDEVSSALESTRMLRLALNVLWDGLPNGMSTGPIRDALETIHDQISEAESADLRRFGLAEHFDIVRPVSPVSPPPPQVTDNITAAVRTLAEKGMLAGQNDAGYRA